MKIVKFTLSLLLTVGVIYFLGRPVSLQNPVEKNKETTLPPLGPFLSPFSGFWKNTESVDKFVSKSIVIPDMKGQVKILFDTRLVPHIFAENLEDAVFAQGYVMAKYRLWQMDIIARSTGGRLSEIMGESLLANDKLQRRRGMLAGAEKAVQSWQQSPETYRLIEAYTAGVNAWINQLAPKDYPIEFKLLNYQPEPWTVLKSALVKKYMDLALCIGEGDLEATNSRQILGSEMFERLYPEFNPNEKPVIPGGTKWNFEPVKIETEKIQEQSAEEIPTEALGLIRHQVYEKERELAGSNNWAVAGSRTKSGKPILCNDPHLQLSLPSIWFELQLHAPEINAYGVGIPGIPGLLIGFNENIAWGETNVGHDVLDWYRVSWTDGSKTTYQSDGAVKKVVEVVNAFKVKGLETPVFDTVKWTEWGPIVYESEDNPHQDLVMRWVGHDAPNSQDLVTFLQLNTGKNYSDYQKAMQYFDFPAQNFVFASKDGDIAITVDGRFPLKRAGQGRFVEEAAQAKNHWAGWIPRELIPKTKNPKRGFVASANQRSTDQSYPYYYNSTHFEQFRGRYLVEQLSEMKDITAQDMMKLQNSNYSLHAAESLPVLLQLIDSAQLSQTETISLNRLKGWDYTYEKDAVEPAIFEAWWKNFSEATFDELTVWRDSVPVLMPENWRLTKLAKEAPKDIIFDIQKTPEREAAADIATLSYKKAMEELADKLVTPGFDWASQKATSIYHLARIPAFSRMNLDAGGNRNALNALTESFGPSWRMVVELGDEVKAWGVFPGGQSGNPGSPFYDTGIDKWIKGEYNELFFMKNEQDNRQPLLFSLSIN